MFIKFNDSDIRYEVGYIIDYIDVIVVKGCETLPNNNLSGFRLYDEDRSEKDYSRFIYKFNVNTELDKDVIILSSSDDMVESDSHPISNYYIKSDDNDTTDDILNIQKNDFISNSKESLREYLKDNPIKSFAHGGVEGIYSVTEEKQQLMTSQYMTYQIKKQCGFDARLTWNETGKECEEWTETEFLQLVMEIEAYVHPLVAYQQSLETQIMNCTTREELNNIIIDYSSVITK